MSPSLPARANLDWLRNRAKQTLATIRRTTPAAKLADAQLAVAREFGCSSWRQLKATVDALRAADSPPPQPTVPIDDAITGPFLQMVGTGRTPEVRRALAAIPILVNAVGPHPFWGGRPQALHVAIETGRRPMIDLLLSAGADVNGSNREYDLWSPLMLAVDRKRPAVIRLLRSRGAKVGLPEALMLGDDQAVARLLRAAAGNLPTAPNAGSLLMFARTPKAIDWLLAAGVATDTKDRWGATPIEALSRLGKAGRPLVRHLMEQGLTPEVAEFARMGDKAGLIDAARGNSAALRHPSVLMAAVDFRHRALARWLLRQGADPNGRSGAADRTPLHSAAWNGDLAMAELLIGSGADPTLRDHQYDGNARGWAETAIEVTANERCRAVMDYLAGFDHRVEDPVDPPKWGPEAG